MNTLLTATAALLALFSQSQDPRFLVAYGVAAKSADSKCACNKPKPQDLERSCSSCCKPSCSSCSSCCKSEADVEKCACNKPKQDLEKSCSSCSKPSCSSCSSCCKSEADVEKCACNKPKPQDVEKS